MSTPAARRSVIVSVTSSSVSPMPTMLGLASVDGAARISRRDGAEAAAARARVAEEHDRRGAFGPALADVRTARLFADRVEVERAQRLLEMRVRLAAGRAHLEPRRLGG